MLKALSLLILLLAIVASDVWAFNEVVNGDDIRRALGTQNVSSDLSRIKIAVLDNGFRGYTPNKGMLPDSAELIAGPLNTSDISSHGLGMAQIAWEASGKSPNGPKFYLINSYGFTNFKAAIDFVIKNKVDIVLYSQVWTFGSNFDGKGFINAAVNRAVDAGVVWINAAGNLGGQVFNGKTSDRSVGIENKLDDNSFTLTLTWDDFFDSEDVCSTKDLNLELYDSRGDLVKKSELIQSGAKPDPKDPKDTRSCYARESVSLQNLEKGTYTAKVTGNKNSSYRLIFTENRMGSVKFTQENTGSQIMPPADNPNVFVIGEESEFSARGPVKPDMLVQKSQVAFSNGDQLAGTSNAAAMVAGAVAVIKGKRPKLTTDDLIQYGKKFRQVSVPREMTPPQWAPAIVRAQVPKDGVLAVSEGRYVILVSGDPTKHPSLTRFNLWMRRPNDIVACHQEMQTCLVYPREQSGAIVAPMIEFRQVDRKLGRPAFWDAETLNFF